MATLCVQMLLCVVYLVTMATCSQSKIYAQPHGVILTASTRTVTPEVTADLSMECQLEPYLAHQFKETLVVRLIKNESDVYTVIARLNKGRPRDEIWVNQTEDISGTGHVREIAEGDWISNTTLKVAWDLVSGNTAGHYYCDVTGYDQEDQVLWDSSPMVELKVNRFHGHQTLVMKMLKKVARLRMSVVGQIEEIKTTLLDGILELQESRCGRGRHRMACKLKERVHRKLNHLQTEWMTRLDNEAVFVWKLRDELDTVYRANQETLTVN